MEYISATGVGERKRAKSEEWLRELFLFFSEFQLYLRCDLSEWDMPFKIFNIKDIVKIKERH